ncbi:tyrosine-type recombinase/integrase [Desulfovibrio falkowii]|uniref:Tyr recombinase domain-containing protein n=1 Tax=Desulfovibrio falkowii TaxID=3136602 RepID=A0ABQ0E5U4_9BACT
MVTLDDAWNFYLSTRHLTRAGYLADFSRYRVHLEPYWHGKSLASIRTVDVQRFTFYLYKKGIGHQTVKLCLAQMRKIMRRAIMLELYNGPMPFFEMPNFDSVRYRFLSEHETKILFIELKNMSEFWYEVASLSLYTGMRSGEIFSLKGKNVNFHQKNIILHETKNKKQRIVPLNDQAMQIVEDRVSGFDSLLFGQLGSPNKKYEKVSKVFRQAVERCGLNDGITDNRHRVVFHTLRHTFASWLVQKGTPLFVVSKLLGHSSIKVTERYAHLAPEQGHHAVNILPQI